MTLPVEHNFSIYQGDDFARSVSIKDSTGAPIDISTWEFEAQIRPSAGSTTLTDSFDIAVEQAEGGALTMALSSEQTRGLDTRRSYAWDLQTTQAGTIRTLVRGYVRVMPDVTRST